MKMRQSTIKSCIKNIKKATQVQFRTCVAFKSFK